MALPRNSRCRNVWAVWAWVPFWNQGRDCKGKVASKQWWFPTYLWKYVSKVDHFHRWGVQGLIDKKNTAHALFEHGLKKMWYVGCFFNPCLFVLFQWKMDQHTGGNPERSASSSNFFNDCCKKKTMRQKNDAPKFGGYTSWFFFFCGIDSYSKDSSHQNFNPPNLLISDVGHVEQTPSMEYTI